MSELERKQINFTIVPEEAPGPRTYSNFCAIAHTPFDFTLTFCEVMPLSEKELQRGRERARRPRSRARPDRRAGAVRPEPHLGPAEHMRVFSETYSNAGWSKGRFTESP